MAKTSEPPKKRASKRTTPAATPADAAGAQDPASRAASPAAKPAKRAASARPTTQRSARKAATVDPAAVADRAYFRFVERGYAHGHDFEDWIVAERELADGAGKRGARAAG